MLRWLVLLGAVACTVTDDAPTDDTGPVDPDDFTLDFTVERAEDPLGMFMSVWGASPDDVWVVGGQKAGDGFVLRGTAGDFTALDLPAGTPMLNWVHGTGPDDVWMGGLGGAVLHWDGAGWDTFDLDVDGAIWGLHARGPDDVLAVGGLWFSEGGPFAHRWDGTDFTALTLPDDVTEGSLFKTTAWADGWVVVGSGGQSVVVDDEGVRSVPNPDGEDMVTVSVAPGEDPLAVGGFTQGRVWRFGGEEAGWTKATDAFAKLNGVHVLGNGLAVAVGDRGSTGIYDDRDGSWTENSPPFTVDLLHATWVDATGTTYAVGGNFLTSDETFHGVLAVSDP